MVVLDRSLCFEFPDDPACWLTENEYIFVSDLLVAPLFEEGAERKVYLPPGRWIDYASSRAFEGARWHNTAAGEVPMVLLVRAGAAVPHAALARSTKDIDWKQIDLRVFNTSDQSATAHFALPAGDRYKLKLSRGQDSTFRLDDDPLKDKVHWQVTETRGSERGTEKAGR